MRFTRAATTIAITGAALAAPAAAQADLSAARAQRAARTAVAPLPVEATHCFKATSPRRRGVDTAFCVVSVAASIGERCRVIVRVTERSRPRRVTARVTIPLRCQVSLPPRGGD